MGDCGNRLVDGEAGFAEAQACYADLGRRSRAVWIGANYLTHRDKAGCTAAEVLSDQSLDALRVPQEFCGLHWTAF